MAKAHAEANQHVADHYAQASAEGSVGEKKRQTPTPKFTKLQDVKFLPRSELQYVEWDWVVVLGVGSCGWSVFG